MRNVLEWLEERSATMGDTPAVCDIHGQLTFAQLQERASQVGTWVASQVVPRTPVALYLEKSTQCLAAMLGAVYARCFYSVLDVRQPADRLASIMATLQPGLVLTDDANFDRAQEMLGCHGVPIVRISDIGCRVDQEVLSALRASALDIDPLYVNFTSGSTGVPKGVAVAHRSVIDFIGHFTSIFVITSQDRIGNQAPFDFDVSVKDIYSCLATGATMHLIPREYFSQPTLLMDFLCDRQITTCTWAVSAMCFVSIMGGFDYRVPTTINKVIFSGEVMPPKQLAKWRRALPDATYVNVYGPTEITCNCTYHGVERDYAKDEVIPAGKAFPNEQVFLLDGDTLVTNPGEHGEVCVAGTCLALGYYNDPVRTAEAFVPNPLSPQVMELMYRTGDLGMWNEEGQLVYVGRKDHQIKHMGQRIELGEIEAVAAGFDGVEQACCIYDHKKKRISMFFAGVLSEDELRDALAGKLPHYMVPGQMVRLDALPLTKNGKVDRTALAAIKPKGAR